MEIYPAIDLRGGRVVRLNQGDARRETVYSHDPVAQAESFLAAGARWLHVVDLDRAFGTGDNVAVVEAVVQRAAGRARVQYGGGLRSLDAISSAIGAGVARVVIGTAAVTDPGLVEQAVAAFGHERVAVGLDARDGMLAIRGWEEQSSVSVAEAARRALAGGVRTIVYTDIARDGMLAGPDLDGCERLVALGADVIASGGFASLSDVVAAGKVGCGGAILGRSLYEGSIELAQAVAID